MAAPPVLAGDAELVEAQVGGQFGDVAGHGGGVVAGQGTLGAAGASVVDRDDGVVRGQQGHDVAPVRHGLRYAVHQEHRLAGAVAAGDGAGSSSAQPMERSDVEVPRPGRARQIQAARARRYR